MRGRTPAAWLAALAAIAALPEPALAFDCSARGGRPWRELTSEHFVLATDLTASEASDLLNELELMRAAVLGALFLNPPAFPGRLPVVAFRSTDDFHEFAPEKVDAYFAHLGDVERVIVTPGVHAFKGRYVLAHELTHYFTAFALLRQPAWLREGLACYLEPLGTVALGAKPKVGTVPETRKVRTRRDDRVPLQDLLAWDGRPVEFHPERYYDTAWLLVHYLNNKRPKEFGDFQQRLALAESPQAAWRAVFPEYDPDKKAALDELEVALDLHIRGAYRYRELDLKVSPSFTERPMSSTEVHAIRFRLSGLRRGGRDDAALKAELAEALAEDPGDPIALLTRAALDKGDVVDAARRAVAAHPESWRAWHFLGGALEKGDPAEQEEALRKAVALAPDEPVVLNSLAWLLVSRGRSGEGLPLARKAARLAPYSAYVLDTLAAVVSDLGQCAEALGAQRRALDVLPEGAPQRARDRLRERLATYERQCGSVPAGPAR